MAKCYPCNEKGHNMYCFEFPSVTFVGFNYSAAAAIAYNFK